MGRVSSVDAHLEASPTDIATSDPGALMRGTSRRVARSGEAARLLRDVDKTPQPEVRLSGRALDPRLWRNGCGTLQNT